MQDTVCTCILVIFVLESKDNRLWMHSCNVEGRYGYRLSITMARFLWRHGKKLHLGSCNDSRRSDQRHDYSGCFSPKRARSYTQAGCILKGRRKRGNAMDAHGSRRETIVAQGPTLSRRRARLVRLQPRHSRPGRCSSWTDRISGERDNTPTPECRPLATGGYLVVGPPHMSHPGARERSTIRTLEFHP